MDPRANWGGPWWSLPHLSGLVVTGPLPEALSWVEDGFGWESGRSWPAEPPPGARVLEVTDPAGWVDLVERFPLVVTASRRHEWWRVTGWNRGWAIPDRLGPRHHLVADRRRPRSWGADRLATYRRPVGSGRLSGQAEGSSGEASAGAVSVPVSSPTASSRTGT
ncbi:hypothetical protein [Blastococcus sp. LR1]|uniref:hypothetical protein n=1 Tax=Blastococcus sp. LR1 TaxID=2877000 RepID=UPI001CC911FC|nr:hypothetical protein [Blastococcus sp. LR1]MCA0145537.1 hypothetical protein [Blastococcus sp. LR1]